MAFCRNCGTEMADTAPACPQCGHPGVQQSMAKRMEGSAVAALILGIVGLTMCPFIPSIIAVIVGKQARAKIATDPENIDGDQLARVGVILGWIGIGLGIIGIALIALALVFLPWGGPDVNFGTY